MSPFNRENLRPASPMCILRAVLREDAVEILFVGNHNRAYLDSKVDEIARVRWQFDDKVPGAGVVILADGALGMIGVRLQGVINTTGEIRQTLVGLLGEDLVAHAVDDRIANLLRLH